LKKWLFSHRTRQRRIKIVGYVTFCSKKTGQACHDSGFGYKLLQSFVTRSKGPGFLAMWRPNKYRVASVALAALLLLAAPLAQAQDTAPKKPAPFPDFTFKRIAAPKPGTAPKITVQIEIDRPRAEAAAPPSEDAPSDEPAGEYAWFWSEISPSISDTGPGRLEPALNKIKDAGRLSGPRVTDLHAVLKDYNSEILLASVGTRVSPALVLSVISVESAGVAGAVSSAGATGLMQLMPDTAKRFGVNDISDPAENIKGGVAYLDWLMGHFNGDPILALAAYNAGEGSVSRYEGVPPFAETRGYVPKVLAAWSVARGLCKTPPELISDGCAFDLGGG
jgi:soluble lytic murein transglycosylase-like protein